jgi:hypothetical protein
VKTIMRSRRDRYLAKFSIILITLALIAGMVSCAGVRYELTISSTEGGEVTEPGEATYLRGEGKVVNLVATPDEGYRFVNWTGNVSTIANVTAAATNITMDGDYSITANFDIEILEIWNWNDLDAIRNNLHSQHILMTSLNSTTDGYNKTASPTANDGEGWEPIGTEPIGTWSRPFAGSFDGQGNNISDLYINRTTEDNVGLFGYVDKDGVVQNVTVVNATVTGKDKDYVGGLVGWNGGNVSSSNYIGSVNGYNYVGGLVGCNQGTVEKSYSTGSVTSEEGYYIGGLVGWNGGTVEENSYSTGSVTGGDGVGGLVGKNWGDVLDSHSTGSVDGNEDVGGLVGRNEGKKSTVSDSYSTGSVSGGENVGGLVGINYGGNVSSSNSTGSVTGESYVGGLVGSNIKRDTVRGTVSNSYSTGNVTGKVGVGGLVGRNYDGIVSNSHYNYDEVLIKGENMIKGEKIITIGALYAEDFEEWLAEDKFLDFNGRLGQDPKDGYYLVNNVSDFKELLAFGQDDLKFRLTNDLYLGDEHNFYIPYFVGEFESNDHEIHEISKLTLDLDFVCNVGLFGYLALGGSVTQVGVEDVDITGASSVGGLVGDNNGNVDNSYSSGTVTGDNYVGGLVGHNYGQGTVRNSYSNGIVIGIADVGGLVGHNQGTVEKSNSTVSVNKNLKNYGDVVGGLVGFNEHTVSDSYSKGSVNGYNYVGGLVGENSYKVSDSYSTGSVTSEEGSYIGGLVGSNGDSGTVSDSYSTGSVSGNLHVGGLVGENSYKVSDSYYSTGSVSGNNQVGGLVGSNGDSGTVSDSYSAGSVSGNLHVGGLVGGNYGNVADSFWEENSGMTDGVGTGDGDDAGITGKSEQEMKDYETYRLKGWDIVKIEDYVDQTWYIEDGNDYPRLGWQKP